MDTFKINGTDFGVGSVVCKIEDGIISDLTIKSDAKMINSSIVDGKSEKWDWLTVSPEFNFRGVPSEQKDNKIVIEITEELLDENDITFYMIEHFDLYGTLTITNDCIIVSGEIRRHMSDKKLYSLEIAAKR